MSSIAPERSKNEYKRLDLIGTGGMAEVYRCVLSGQQGFEKRVVLKKLLPQVAQNSEIVTNFIDEARLAALLQHENIATVYDFGEMDGSYFIAMEYLFGKDLHNILQRAKEADCPMDMEAALLITKNICEGMDYAHSLLDLHHHPLNIIHRDLSPHNVFVTYDGKIKIIDFGVAKAEIFDNRTRVGVVKGKISYMSPEQLTDGEIDSRSDIFSIGILLYEMLSGIRMYTGDTATLIRKCMHVEYQDLEEVQPELPPEVYSIVQKALEKDQKKRYQSCTQMAGDIENCLYLMKKRPNTQIVKEYIRVLFSGEYETEKNGLFAESEKADATALAESDKTVREEKTVLIDSASVVATRESTGLQDVKRPVAGKWRFFQKLILGLGILVFVMVFLLLYISGLIVPNEPGRSKVLPYVTSSGTVEVSLEDPVENLTKQPVEQQEIVVEEPSLGTDEAEIKTLLGKAREALDNNRLTLPRDESAYSYYQQVLALTPNNNVARDGLRHIGDKYAELAERALAGKDFNRAGAQINKGLSVTPGSGRLLSLQERVVLEKRKLIKQLMQKARGAMAKNNLTTPAGTSAFRYYSDILTLDGRNTGALRGIRAIGDRYAALADDAYMNMNLKNARSYVSKGLKVVPDHKLLLELQKDLTRSTPGIFLRSLEKSLKPLLN